MRRCETQAIGAVLQEYLKELQIDQKLKEIRLIGSWESVMGRTVTRYTKSIALKNRVLFVQMTSSIARNELVMMRQGIIEAMNKNAGEKMIDDIVIR